jgi:hypothetical protein
MLGNGKKNIGYDLSSYTNKSAVVYDADAQAYFDRVTAAGGTLTTAEKNAVNTLTLTLKSNGIWTNLLAIYPYVGGSAASCAQNLRSATYTGTFNGGWTFSSLGAKPNGLNGYFNTFLVPLTAGLARNSFSMSTFLNTFAKTGAWQMGGVGSNSSYNFIGAHIFSATQGTYANQNFSANTIIDATNVNGFLATDRIAQPEFKYFKGIVPTTQTLVSTASQATYPIIMGAGGDFGGAITAYDDARICFGHIGNGLGNTLMIALATAAITFNTTLARL